MTIYLKDSEGAAAFPVPDDFREYGMSLRDWFAGQAITGLVVSDGFVRNGDSTQRGADWAYEIADAMLRARQRGEGVE